MNVIAVLPTTEQVQAVAGPFLIIALLLGAIMMLLGIIMLVGSLIHTMWRNHGRQGRRD